ncbi:MAG: YdcF family protein [Oscillospiraceae bacterium]|nr:YdcF family protein [Oscillospiraceae bacterium]
MFSIDPAARKPSLRVLWILTAVTCLCLAFLLFRGWNESRMLFISQVLLCCFFFIAVVILLVTFFRQLRCNPYTYGTIYYAGFSLFFLFVFITNLRMTIRSWTDPAIYCRPQIILSTLLYSARDYVYFSAPFLFLFSAVLFISNISLIRHEGRRFVNILGMILAVLLVGGELVLLRMNRGMGGSQLQVILYVLGGNLLTAIFLYFECMMIGTIVADVIAAVFEPPYDRDYMIILGCGIRKDGTPSPLLRGRIDRAVQFYNRQLEETGKKLVFVPSGGKGGDEPVSESECMANYLLTQGIPGNQILKEDQSSNTSENMRFSADKIHALTPDAKVAFSTNHYHVFRSGILAGQANLSAVGIGARTKYYFWPNAAVREFVGLLAAHRRSQLLVILSIVLFYCGLTFLLFLL